MKAENSEPRAGKIIRLLDEYTVVFNLGTRDGVTNDMRFGVYSPWIKIVDPDTGEDLGPYRKRKAVVVVIETHERFSIASPPKIRRQRTVQTGVFGVGGSTKETDIITEPLDVVSSQVERIDGADAILLGDVVESLEPRAVTA